MKPFLCFIEHALATIIIICQENFKKLIKVAAMLVFFCGIFDKMENSSPSLN